MEHLPQFQLRVRGSAPARPSDSPWQICRRPGRQAWQVVEKQASVGGGGGLGRRTSTKNNMGTIWPCLQVPDLSLSLSLFLSLPLSLSFPLCRCVQRVLSQQGNNLRLVDVVWQVCIQASFKGCGVWVIPLRTLGLKQIQIAISPQNE